MKYKSYTEQKSALDQFYTKESVAKQCIDRIEVHTYNKVIEPSAGNGSFSKNIEHENLVAIDIDPRHQSIIKKDWLEYKDDDKNILIIGNPPFGRRNNLAKEFIKHALELDGVETIAFVLPNTYNKYTTQKIFPKEWKLIDVWKLPENSFILDDKEYHVPCSFYIWTIRASHINLRFDPEKYKTCNDFEFCKASEADFFIMGASPHVVKYTDEVTPNNRGYYIRAKEITPSDLRERFIQKRFYGNSSVQGGAFWMTKAEIIKAYIEEYGDNGNTKNIIKDS